LRSSILNKHPCHVLCDNKTMANHSSSKSVVPITVLHRQFWTGTGSKKHAIQLAREQGHQVVVGFTRPSSRCYGSFKDVAEMISTCQDKDKPGTLMDFMGLYHVTVDYNLFIPYFDVEWTARQEEAYPWLTLPQILQDIKHAMWHVWRFSLVDNDFVIMEASGMSSKGEYKHSYHVLVRPETPVVVQKGELKQLLEVCLAKYAVRDLDNPTRAQHVIDPAVYGSNFDYRMVYQGKPGGERQLLPITHPNQPLETFLLDYVPPGAQQLRSQMPGANPPALPSQLTPVAPPLKDDDPMPTGPSSPEAVSRKRKWLATQFSFLTAAGKMHIAQRALQQAGVSDITPVSVEGSSVFCITDKKQGRQCLCTPGEHHKSNNVYLQFCRDGFLQYLCLAPGCSKHRAALSSWLPFLKDPRELIDNRPALVDVNAVDASLRAMVINCRPNDAPSYTMLKAVFEVANFMVLTPHGFMRTVDPGDEIVGDHTLHQTNTKGIKDTYKAIQYQTFKPPAKKGEQPKMDKHSFVDHWLADPKQRLYRKVDFLPPPKVCPPDVYNLFDGFDAEKWDEESPGDISGWEALLELASDFDPETARRIDAWLADLIQNPGQNSEAGVNISSFQKGSGKDTLVEVPKLIMGARYYMETACPAQELLGTHAVGLRRKLLVHVNETDELRKHMGRVRHLMTAKQVQVNEKYQAQYDIANYARWLVSGNDMGLVEANRRYLVCKMSAERVGDTAFWIWIRGWMADKRNLRAVYDHWKVMDLSSIPNMQAYFRSHITGAQVEATMGTSDNITLWAVGMVEAWREQGEAAPPTAVCTSDELYSNFKRWGEKSKMWGDQISHNKGKFSQQLGYRYKAGESAPGQPDSAPFISVRNIGAQKLKGWVITWASWHRELVKANFMSAEVQVETIDMEGTEGTLGQLVEGNDCDDL
jgi:hypothetical protein